MINLFCITVMLLPMILSVVVNKHGKQFYEIPLKRNMNSCQGIYV